MFDLENYPQENLELMGLAWSPMPSDHVTAKFDLAIFMHESAAGLVGVAEYATDLFERATIERWMRYFDRALAAIDAQPDLPLSEWP